MPPGIALCLTLIRLNYPCLDYIFMVPKVVEPLNFCCTDTEKHDGVKSILSQRHVISKGVRRYIATDGDFDGNFEELLFLFSIYHPLLTLQKIRFYGEVIEEKVSELLTYIS